MLNGDLFHCGYSYHIFNLIVQECIQWIRPYVENIRLSILYIQTSPKRFQEFRQLCVDNGVKPRKFKIDVQHIIC